MYIWILYDRLPYGCTQNMISQDLNSYKCYEFELSFFFFRVIYTVSCAGPCLYYTALPWAACGMGWAHVYGDGVSPCVWGLGWAHMYGWWGDCMGDGMSLCVCGMGWDHEYGGWDKCTGNGMSAWEMGWANVYGGWGETMCMGHGWVHGC